MKGLCIEALENQPTVMLSACGVVTGVTDKNELIVSNSIMERRLTLSESVMLYGLLFDALRYGECIGRYGRSEKNLNAELAPPSEVIQSLLDDELLCVGVGQNDDDALFSMFCSGFLACAVEQNDCGEFLRRKGHWAMYYDRFLPLCQNAAIAIAAFEAVASLSSSMAWQVRDKLPL